MMVLAAVGEVSFVFAGVVAYIWRLQFTFPDFAIVLLVFIVATFFLHRDRFQDLGFGSRGLLVGMKQVAMPTLLIGSVLVIAAIARGGSPHALLTADKLVGLGKYFAWCLLQQFVLQSFFANRLLLVLKDERRAAWMNGAIFAVVHIPNPVLVPVTLLGGYLLTRIFFSTRNLVPLAFAQAIVGSLLSVAVPVSWHHGLRVGPGYYRNRG
jgi:membrane protease YdiL (CAAX protease family)